MKTVVWFVLLLCAMPLGRALQVVAFGGGAPLERALVRIFYWNEDRQSSPGQIVVQYGQPTWKEQYNNAAHFDTLTLGKTCRLGKDYWTTLDTTVTLLSNQQVVPAKQYFLAIRRSALGSQWFLVLTDAAVAKSKKLNAGQSSQAPVAHEIPLVRRATQSFHEKLTIALNRHPEIPTELVLEVLWGPYHLVSRFQADLDDSASSG